jgi:hypothetical protein
LNGRSDAQLATCDCGWCVIINVQLLRPVENGTDIGIDGSIYSAGAGSVRKISGVTEVRTF